MEEGFRRDIASGVATIRDGLVNGTRSVSRLADGWASITASIADVARLAHRTRVLAVNATIEAAWVVDTSGFAIVAERMRALAESTVTAARDVAAVATRTRESTGATAVAMRRAHDYAVFLLAVEGRITGATVAELKSRSDVVHDAVAANDGATGEADAILAQVVDLASEAILLAINAAIEAARAGTRGAGFAVIADEIGTLAREVERVTAEIVATLESIRGRSGRLHRASVVFSAETAKLRDRAAAEKGGLAGADNLAVHAS